MTLQHLQRLELLSADGLASPEERDTLRQAGIDPDGWAPVRSLLVELLAVEAPELAQEVLDALELRDADVGPALRQTLASAPVDQVERVMAALDEANGVGEALRAALAVEAPDLAHDVMAALGHEDRVGDTLRSTLAADAIDLSDDIMAALGLDEAVGTPLRQALATEPVDLADDVMAALGLQEGVGAPLREALAADEIDLSDDIMAALGLQAAEADDADDAAAAAEVVPLRLAPAPAAASVAPRRAWAFPAGAMAAAAALLLVFTGSPPTSQADSLAFELAPINHVDIEELNAGEEVMVQVLQMDDNAPTIIFIDELEPLDEDAGGTPL